MLVKNEKGRKLNKNEEKRRAKKKNRLKKERMMLTGYQLLIAGSREPHNVMVTSFSKSIIAANLLRERERKNSIIHIEQRIYPES